MWSLRGYLFVQKISEKLDENGGEFGSSGITSWNKVQLTQGNNHWEKDEIRGFDAKE